MATIRLVPSTYAFSNSTAMSISDVDNMYNNTSNETYATVTTTQNNTSNYYIYLRGFNFNSVPSNAVVSSFTVKIKARETRLYTSTNASTNYRMGLYNNTTALTNAYTGNLPSTTVKTITISHGNYSWDDIKGYASNFGIRVCVRRSNRNNQGYMYIYGAEIEVNYTQTGSSLYWRNGSWSQYTKIYKKANNSWVLQTISLDLFDGNKIIVSG